MVCLAEFWAAAASRCTRETSRGAAQSINQGLYDGGFTTAWWASHDDTCHIGQEWINSLWSSDAIWWQRSGSTVAQVMACCLTAPSHYLNQCWLIISEVQWHSYKGNCTRDASAINHWNPFQNYISKISFKFPRANELSVTKVMWLSVWQSNILRRTNDKQITLMMMP